MFKKKSRPKCWYLPLISLWEYSALIRPKILMFPPTLWVPACSAVGFSATVEILIHYLGEAGGSADQITAQTIGLNCGVTHCPGKIEYNCRYFLMTFRKWIRKNKFSKNDFYTLQGTMSHRPMTNTSSLKIAAAYSTYYHY